MVIELLSDMLMLSQTYYNINCKDTLALQAEPPLLPKHTIKPKQIKTDHIPLTSRPATIQNTIYHNSHLGFFVGQLKASKKAGALAVVPKTLAHAGL